MPGLFAPSRRVSIRWATVLVAAVALVVSLVTPAQAAHAASTPKGLPVLDPDDDYSHAQWGGTTYTELPRTRSPTPPRRPERMRRPSPAISTTISTGRPSRRASRAHSTAM